MERETRTHTEGRQPQNGPANTSYCEMSIEFSAKVRDAALYLRECKDASQRRNVRCHDDSYCCPGNADLGSEPRATKRQVGVEYGRSDHFPEAASCAGLEGFPSSREARQEFSTNIGLASS